MKLTAFACSLIPIRHTNIENAEGEPVNAMDGWPSEVRLYGFEELKADTEYRLISDHDLEALRTGVQLYINDSDHPSPNHRLNFHISTVVGRKPHAVELWLDVRGSLRFHGDAQTLPKAEFIVCVDLPSYYSRPCLVVSRRWFKNIVERQYALYGLVDVADMKRHLATNGGVEMASAIALSAKIDELALENPTCLFLSFADNVLLRSKWTPLGDSDLNYDPEGFLLLLKRVMLAVQSTVGPSVYAVATQGSDAYIGGSTAPESKASNHVFVGSLGTPFAELFEIEAAAKRSVAENPHEARDLYVSFALLESLRFKDWRHKDNMVVRCRPFVSKLAAQERQRYLPCDVDDLLARIQGAA